MRRLRSWLLRLGGVFGFGRRDREIVDELRTHRDLLADEYMRSGLAPDVARRRAAADFGSVAAAADAYRERRGLPTVEDTVRDGRMAVRSLWRTPVLSASMILVLGLGIGLGTAIVAVFHAIVWAELPVDEPDAVVQISERFAGQFDRTVRGPVSQLSYPELMAYRTSTRAMAAVAASVDARVAWRVGAETRNLNGILVAGDYFAVLKVTPALGRTLTAADARQPVLVVGHRLWTTTFESSSEVIGRVMWLDGAPYTVVGVAPASFSGTGVDSPSVWLPLEARHAAQGTEQLLSESNVSWLQAFGRLAPGSSLASARTEAAVIASRFDQDYPGRRTTVDIARASRLGSAGLKPSHFGTVTAVLGAFLGVLFLICGSNAAALLLARGAARQKEIAVRLALGAARIDIIRQFAAELGVIATASAAVGVLVCMSSLRILARGVPMQDLLLSIQPDTRVFGIAFAAAFVVAALFGLAPARQALGVDCLANLKGEGSVLGRRVPVMRLRRALISVQVAVSVPLLVVAALLGRGVTHAWTANPGYATKGLYAVLPAQADTIPAPGSEQASQPSLSTELANRIALVPGVRAVGRAKVAPFFGEGRSSAGLDVNGPLEAVHFNFIDANFFAALDVRLVAGRSLLDREDDAVVVNASLARRFWGTEQSAIGRVLFVPVPLARNLPPQPLRVVGVTPTIQTTTIGVPDEPTYYRWLTETVDSFVLLRADDSVSVDRVVIDQLGSLSPDSRPTVTSTDARLIAATTPARIGVLAVGSIGLLALLVAAVGVHGVIAYTVSSRTRDIGIHQALGAKRIQILSVILGWTLRGIAIGAAGAVLLLIAVAAVFGGRLRTVFNGVNPLDLPSFLIGLAVLSLVIGLAALLPARRALSMTPLAALRRD